MTMMVVCTAYDCVCCGCHYAAAIVLLLLRAVRVPTASDGVSDDGDSDDGTTV
jgi:hypothetical protein